MSHDAHLNPPPNTHRHQFGFKIHSPCPMLLRSGMHRCSRQGLVLLSYALLQFPALSRSWRYRTARHCSLHPHIGVIVSCSAAVASPGTCKKAAPSRSAKPAKARHKFNIIHSYKFSEKLCKTFQDIDALATSCHAILEKMTNLQMLLKCSVLRTNTRKNAKKCKVGRTSAWLSQIFNIFRF